LYTEKIIEKKRSTQQGTQEKGTENWVEGEGRKHLNKKRKNSTGEGEKGKGYPNSFEVDWKPSRPDVREAGRKEKERGFHAMNR